MSKGIKTSLKTDKKPEKRTKMIQLQGGDDFSRYAFNNQNLIQGKVNMAIQAVSKK